MTGRSVAETGDVGEVALGVVPGAMLDAQVGPFHAHRDSAEAAVLRRGGAVVAEQVVDRGVALHLRERVAEVVRVGEGASSGVGRQRLQRLLRRKQVIELLRHAASRKRAHAARARPGGVSARHRRLQPACIDRIQRHVGTDGRARRRPQLDLVVPAASRHPAAEVEHRLLLLDRAEHVHQGADRAQTRIVVEQVVLGTGGRGFGAGLVGGCGLGRRRFERDAVHGAEACHGRLHLLAVAGEVGDDVQRDIDRGHGHQIRLRHLRVEVLDGGLPGARQFLRFHRAQIEQQDDEPAPCEILPLDGLGLRWQRRIGRHVLRPHSEYRRAWRVRRAFGGHFLHIERDDLLRPIVLPHFEVGGGQAANGIARAIADHQIDDDEIDVGAEDRRRGLLLRAARSGRRHDEQCHENGQPDAWAPSCPP
jgi:hypothetical protein